jgi:glucose/arabinose dehydrogenase
MNARTAPTSVLAALLALAVACAHAASAEPAPAPKPAAQPDPQSVVDPTAPDLVQPTPPSKVKEPKVEHLVTEDSQVRIEETRVRGVTKKIVVHSKIPGMGSYEIQPRDPGVDPENDKGAGMRLFQFGF